MLVFYTQAVNLKDFPAFYGINAGLNCKMDLIISRFIGEHMKGTMNLITMKGNPLTLTGTQPQLGDKAADFEVVANDLSIVRFSSFRGKVCIILSVPSLDTSVCDLMTRKFNEEAGKLGDKVVVITVSMDLPFAQKRWCGAAGIKNVMTFSDYRIADFGNRYGVLIKELRLLARAVFVADKDGVLRYSQIVSELTHEPDYQGALDAVKQLL